MDGRCRRKKKFKGEESASRQHTKFDSVFVSSLSAPKSGKKTQKLIPQKEKKPRNRLGQRARQRLHEELYGQEARHVVQQRNQRKKVRRGGNESGSVQKSKTQKKPGPVHTSREGTVKKTLRARPDLSLTKVQAVEEQASLHPSWQASKKKKELQSIQSFQGQRTVFSDSD